MKRKPGKFGAWSLLIALIPIIVLAIISLVYYIAAFVLMAGPGFGALFGIILLPLVLLLVFAIDCVALIIGIIEIFEKKSNKIAAFSGIILSVAPITLLVALFING